MIPTSFRPLECSSNSSREGGDAPHRERLGGTSAPSGPRVAGPNFISPHRPLCVFGYFPVVGGWFATPVLHQPRNMGMNLLHPKRRPWGGRLPGVGAAPIARRQM